MRLSFLLLVALGLAGCGVLEGVLARFGLPLEQYTSDELRKTLQPHYRWFASGDSQSPGVLLLPGCAGTQPFHVAWAERFQAEGYTVLLVDSFTPRGVTNAEALEGVCEGQHVWGFERAGDVLVSLQAVREHGSVDADRLAVVGWSHGGWGVLDAVVLGGAGETPPLLKDVPAPGLEGVQAAVALYPYCDFGTYLGEHPWPADVNGLLLLAANDANIEPGPCIDWGHAEAGRGAPLRTEVLDADHWFDNPEGFDIVPHAYDAEATRQTEVLIAELLEKAFAETGVR